MYKIKGNKRQRSTNFSVTETECLVDEILKRADVIENKRTDAVIWKQKENAWQDLTKTFNALTAGNRTEKMLKVKYDGIKRTIKQKNNKSRCEKFKTGGGIAKIVVYTSWEKKLLQLILLSLPSENDCDGDSEHSFVDNNDADMTEVVTVIPVPSTTENVPDNIHTEQTWDSWTPATLRTPGNRKLKSSTQYRAFEDKYSSMANSRAELLDLQKIIADQELAKILMEMEYLRKADIRKEEEHQLKMNILKKEHNEHLELIKYKKEKLNSF